MHSRAAHTVAEGSAVPNRWPPPHAWQPARRLPRGPLSNSLGTLPDPGVQQFDHLDDPLGALLRTAFRRTRVKPPLAGYAVELIFGGVASRTRAAQCEGD